MSIGERIKALRKERNMSVEYVAKALGVSLSTVYRYEDSSIEKLPVSVFDKLCEIFSVAPDILRGSETGKSTGSEPVVLPEQFENAEDAMKWLIKIPTLAAFGGYDPDTMSEETIVEFANEILQQLKLVSYKYKQ